MRHYFTKSRQQSRSRAATKSYLRLQDKVEVMERCGDAALILYEFYISNSGRRSFSFSDDSASKALGWKVSKVKQNRLRLKKYGYFLQLSGKIGKDHKVTITFLDPHEIRHVQGLDKQGIPTMVAQLIRAVGESQWLNIEPEIDEILED